MKKTLGSIKVSQEDYENILRAIGIFNSGNILEMSITSFRRLSYKILAQLIIQGKEIPIVFKGDKK